MKLTKIGLLYLKNKLSEGIRLEKLLMEEFPFIGISIVTEKNQLTDETSIIYASFSHAHAIARKIMDNSTKGHPSPYVYQTIHGSIRDLEESALTLPGEYSPLSEINKAEIYNFLEDDIGARAKITDKELHAWIGK